MNFHIKFENTRQWILLFFLLFLLLLLLMFLNKVRDENQVNVDI